jgi:hypothetical protein
MQSWGMTGCSPDAGTGSCAAVEGFVADILARDTRQPLVQDPGIYVAVTLQSCQKQHIGV